ncbi:glycosyltransferase [Geotalea daltonii FRC-32]|uniref:Glycosyltransferase n=1 Tax=Geotalea daltonii (strain DSM 22248 / JCM 15807 / FRC-32) TaxID=316067 RepID=B9M8X2_GEODF|nr:glycosyltransferase family 4 protein [Geotalea daltonii]ACM20468.1 glycosyltransferase [Geotalea daltonii FRC-32]
MKMFFVNNGRVASGAEEHLLDLAPPFIANGVEPVFLVRENGNLKDKLWERGYKVYTVFNNKNLSLPFRIARLIRQEEPDVISVNREHTIYAVLAGYLLALPFLKNRPKLVNVFHTPTGRWYPLLTMLFDGIIATSRYTAQSFYPKNKGMEEMTTIIHYGIEPTAVDTLQKFDRDRPRRIFPDRKFPIIAMVGELWKNQEELIDAAVYLTKVFPDITIAIVGGGGTAHLEEKIRNFGVEKNFILTGRIPREKVTDLFYDCDLSVSTHRNEGFGIVHIESLAAGTPVVAYNSGGLVEIIENGGGVLVGGGTREFAEAIIELLKNDEKRFALGRQGREVVDRYFTLDKMSSAHFAYYSRLMGN